MASGLKSEIGQKLVDLNVSTFSMAPVKVNKDSDILFCQLVWLIVVTCCLFVLCYEHEAEELCI